MPMPTLTITPGDIANWPVLDTDEGEGVKLWFEFDQDFLGHRLPIHFPSIPIDNGTVTSDPATVAVCTKNRRFGRPWVIRCFSLWSEKTEGICLFPACTFIGGRQLVSQGNRVTVGLITINVEPY